MNREANLSTTYFQIRWASGALDWEQHDTRDKAEKSAEQLARPDEEYTIEEVRDGKCPATQVHALKRAQRARRRLGGAAPLRSVGSRSK